MSECVEIEVEIIATDEEGFNGNFKLRGADRKRSHSSSAAPFTTTSKAIKAGKDLA